MRYSPTIGRRMSTYIYEKSAIYSVLSSFVDTFQNEPEQAKLPGKEDNTAYLAPFSFCTLKFQNKHILLPNVGECLGLQEISIEKVVSNYGGILLAAKIILLEISILLIALDALDSFFLIHGKWIWKNSSHVFKFINLVEKRGSWIWKSFLSILWKAFPSRVSVMENFASGYS